MKAVIVLIEQDSQAIPIARGIAGERVGTVYVADMNEEDLRELQEEEMQVDPPRGSSPLEKYGNMSVRERRESGMPDPTR